MVGKDLSYGRNPGIPNYFPRHQEFPLSCQKVELQPACLLAGQDSVSPSYIKLPSSKRQHNRCQLSFHLEKRNRLWRESFAAEGTGQCQVLLQKGSANRLKWLCQFTLEMENNSTVYSYGIRGGNGACSTLSLLSWEVVGSAQKLPHSNTSSLRSQWGTGYYLYSCLGESSKNIIVQPFLLSPPTPSPPPKTLTICQKTSNAYLTKLVTGRPLLSPWRSRWMASIIVPHLNFSSSVSVIYCHEII